MSALAFTDNATLSGTRITADGYLVAEVRCARIGCQSYLASELGDGGEGVITVYRPETAVFDRASLMTYTGKPVTIGHPSEMVTAENWRKYAVGDIGEDVVRDGEYVRVPIKLMDAAAIKAVQDGTREISMGYTTDIRRQDGVAPDGTPYQAVQTGPIKINHLALVDKARGGENLRLGDGAGKDRTRWGVSPFNDREVPIMADANMRTVVIDGLSVITTDQGAQALEKLTKTITDMKAELTGAAKKAQEEAEAKDKELAAKDAEIKSLKDAVLTEDAKAKLVADRVALETVVAKITSDVKPAGLTDAALRKAVVASKLGDEALVGKSDAYIDARFDILAEDAGQNDEAAPQRDALKDGLKQQPLTAGAWGDSAFASAGVTMKKGA